MLYGRRFLVVDHTFGWAPYDIFGDDEMTAGCSSWW
jgi:hypothetical protein